MAAQVGFTYVVRSVSEGKYDVVAAFQVIREDALDGSLIIAFKLIREFPIARVLREPHDNKGFDGLDGE